MVSFHNRTEIKMMVLIAISDCDETVSISLKPRQKVAMNTLLAGKDVFTISLLGSEKVVLSPLRA